MRMEAQMKAAFWMENAYFDEQTRQEVRNLPLEEIEERFYTDLEFGTGGLRGKMGAGTNRMNRYVVRKITQGLADVLCRQGERAMRQGVVIAFDSRLRSAEFARETALVLAKNGIRVYLFASLRPTPELSFAIRYYHAAAGVNITASHNPKEYNGYKVYGADGGQLTPEKAEEIAEQIQQRTEWQIGRMTEAEARQSGRLLELGRETDELYFQALLVQMLYPELVREQGNRLRIVYTPLHGAGIMAIPAVLRGAGFTDLHIVSAQSMPDGAFPTVQLPNPESPEAFRWALAEAETRKADLVLASDPDADRLGAYVRDKTGDYVRLNGNQIGVLLLYYLLSQRKKQGNLPPDGKVVTSIASTELGGEIARAFGVERILVPVGFKYIGEQIRRMETEKKGTFLFGYEESFGYLAGTHARDKDAVQAALLLAEAALYYKTMENRTLPRVLEEIYRQFGWYDDRQFSVVREGRKGKIEINAMMQCLRSGAFQQLGGVPIAAVEDYADSVCTDLRDGSSRPLSLPKSNALRYLLCGGGFVLARPSGTEPKMKFYISVRGTSCARIEEQICGIQEDIRRIIGL